MFTYSVEFFEVLKGRAEPDLVHLYSFINPFDRKEIVYLELQNFKNHHGCNDSFLQNDSIVLCQFIHGRVFEYFLLISSKNELCFHNFNR